jgi:formate hydrogenlyase subunit 3/multisubunit Na+/H+ antiporter MnhD subunit
MNNLLLYMIVVPIILGTLCIILPKKVKFIREFLAFIGSSGIMVMSIRLFLQRPVIWTFNESIILKLDNLGGFIILAASLLGFLNVIYSIKYMQGKGQQGIYYGSVLWTLGATCGVILTNHLILLLLFWGFLGITLYLLVHTNTNNAASAAKKALIIIGGSDALILLGIGFIYSLTNTFLMDKIVISFQEISAYLAFILLVMGVFAKIGAIPLHTWIPDVSENAPLSVSALLPGALDKLLGVYLIARLYLNLFKMSEIMNLLLLIIGALTVIISVTMGLIQSDGKKLLGYLIISGAGYMVLGFGSGDPTGIAGGLFYMVNSAFWTCCLFLCLGSVEHRTDNTKLEEVGGLVKLMPVTFITTIIASLSISGIPPLNGFASKWLIYQGLINLGKNGNNIWILWLVIAMFGSALTLAICAKFIHSIFLGIPSKNLESKNINEVNLWMTIPMVIISFICILSGIFSFSAPIKDFLLTVIPQFSLIGIWSSGLATLMILLGLVIGFIIYISGNLKGVREADSFIGGEQLSSEHRVTGTNFYETIRGINILNKIYCWAEAKWFDIYDQCGRMALNFAKLFQKAHSGVLTLYLFWIVIGLIILIFVLMCK